MKGFGRRPLRVKGFGRRPLGGRSCRVKGMVKGFGRRGRRPLEGEGFRTPAPWRTVVQGEGYGEGFRTPAPWRTVVRGLGPAFETLPRRKPRAGRGAAWSGASYGDLRIADGSGVSARGPVARNLGGGNDDDERVRLRGCAALARARRSGRPDDLERTSASCPGARVGRRR